MEFSTATASPSRANYIFTLTSPSVAADRADRPQQSSRYAVMIEGALVSIALTVIALVIHGYHPYAEDGGPYLSIVLKTLHPDLYPSSLQFASVFTRFSLFPGLISVLVRSTRLQPLTVNFLLYLFSIWTTLFAAWTIAVLSYSSRTARYGAVSLLALLLTLPIAGTSLLLMDPYVTARSISTPCGLFALAAMLHIARERHLGRGLPWISAAACLLCIMIAGLVHPLMAGYSGAYLVLVFVLSHSTKAKGFWLATLLCSLALVLAACLFHWGLPATPDSLEAARTRAYWFVQNWRWHEIAGLIIPLLVLAALISAYVPRMQQAARWMVGGAMAIGVTAILVSLAFVHENSSVDEVARLQPLRVFHVFYIITILALGAYAAVRLTMIRRWMPAVLFVLLGMAMFYVQSQTFPGSAHIECPWCAPQNDWERAFIWAREHTPRNARFALDANYITYSGEDAQYFSAIAERSALPDYVKDGGLAALFPSFADNWAVAQAAQAGLNQATDAERAAVLRPFSVQWIVLPASSKTGLPCPFSNWTVKICRIAL